MKVKLLFFLFFTTVLSPLFSQRILVLDVMGIKTKRIKYHSGDYIAVRVKNDKVVYKGFLEVITDSSFTVNDNLVYLDSLDAVIKKNKAPKAISIQAFVVGGVTAVISGLNNGINKGEVFPGDDSYVVPAAFFGLGAVFLPWWKKTYRINDKNCIAKILDMTPVLPQIE